MGEKNALDKLRELLDARGVHHVGDSDTVRWIGRDGCVCRAYTRAYSRRADLCLDVSITYVPPERAIEATLGPQIVHCEGCKHCMSFWKSDYCDYFSHVTNDPDGFCAWGERKEVDE